MERRRPSPPARCSADARGRPLRALFVGHLSQRKGLADLHEAMAQRPRAWSTLTLVGPPYHDGLLRLWTG